MNFNFMISGNKAFPGFLAISDLMTVGTLFHFSFLWSVCWAWKTHAYFFHKWNSDSFFSIICFNSKSSSFLSSSHVSSISDSSWKRNVLILWISVHRRFKVERLSWNGIFIICTSRFVLFPPECYGCVLGNPFSNNQWWFEKIFWSWKIISSYPSFLKAGQDISIWHYSDMAV